MGGVYAQITNYNPYVIPSGPNDVSTAWTMVDDASEHTGWFQVGWLKWPSLFGQTASGPWVFVQDHEPVDGGNPFTQVYYSATLGQSWYYTSTFNPVIGRDSNGVPTTGQMIAYVNGSTRLTGARNAYFTPNAALLDGEIHDWADQVPGGAQSPVVFGDAHIWYPAGYLGSNAGSWQFFKGVVANSAPTIAGSIPGDGQTVDYTIQPPQALEIWDKRCS